MPRRQAAGIGVGVGAGGAGTARAAQGAGWNGIGDGDGAAGCRGGELHRRRHATGAGGASGSSITAM